MVHHGHDHDHAHEGPARVHGPGCGHDHGHDHAHDPRSQSLATAGHVHGPGCQHDQNHLSPPRCFTSCGWPRQPCRWGLQLLRGLEAAVEAGTVRDEASGRTVAAESTGTDQAQRRAALVARARRAQRPMPPCKPCNDWVLQTRETSESLQQTQQMGRSLLAWLRGLVDAHPLLPLAQQLSPPTWPVILACASPCAARRWKPAALPPLAGPRT